MSEITERMMRGRYVSKQECMDHAGELERLFDAYPRAMAAMEQHEHEIKNCACEYDGGYGEDGSQVRRFPVRGCVVHSIDDIEHWAEIDFPVEEI